MKSSCCDLSLSNRYCTIRTSTKNMVVQLQSRLQGSRAAAQGSRAGRHLHRFMCAAATADYRSKDNKDIRVLVVGSTGYIGKFVVKELVKRGYDVVAFAREKSGVGGKASMEDTVKVGACQHRVHAEAFHKQVVQAVCQREASWGM